MINHAWCAQNWPMPRPLGLIATFLAVVVAWVFFRAPTLNVAGHMLKAMFDVTHLDLARAFANRIIAPNAALPILLILLAIALAAPNTSEIFYRARPAIREQTTAPHRNPAIPTVLIWRPGWRWGAALGLLLAASFVRLGGDSPFLYFRF